MTEVGVVDLARALRELQERFGLTTVGGGASVA